MLQGESFKPLSTLRDDGVAFLGSFLRGTSLKVPCRRGQLAARSWLLIIGDTEMKATFASIAEREMHVS